MASNSFGNIFRMTTWGESHGKAIGVVIDGCPAGVAISAEEINHALAQRSPGKSLYTSPRAEPDRAEIYSGVMAGKTTGAPLSIIIPNKDADASSYEPIKNLLRPGHANYTYTQKYGCFDYRGGGRASARETACRVAAGAVAQKLLAGTGIGVISYLNSVGNIAVAETSWQQEDLAALVAKSKIFCPDLVAELSMQQAIEVAMSHGDSLGGSVSFWASNLPVGLGDPVYEKLEANLAQAMLSLPASKGFEIGHGFGATRMKGSEHNDCFIPDPDQPMRSNHAGGTLGGISTGMPLMGRVAFKPTSSIQQTQETVDDQGNPQLFRLPPGSRHDPCVAIRAVPVVSAMCWVVLADAWLLQRCSRV